MTITRHALQDLSLAADSLARAAGWDSEPAPSLGQRLVAARQSGQRSVGLTGGIRALSSASFTAELAAGQPVSLQAHRRRLYLRDLVPVIPSTTSFVPFVRELNPQSAEMGASGVAEGNSKPDASNGVAFQPITITAGTLAASITVTDQLWSDAPAFVAYVDGELPYWIRVREEYACLRGNAEVVNGGITGVLNDAAVTAGSAGSNLFTTAAALCGGIAGNGAVPDAVFVSAVDYYAAIVAHMMGSTPIPPQVLELLPPILPTVTLATGTVVAGDFGNGAVMIERDEVSVAVYDQHSDYRARGLALVLGEERVGFHVVKPWAFSYATGVTP